MSKFFTPSIMYIPRELKEKLRARLRANYHYVVAMDVAISQRVDRDRGRYSSRCKYHKIDHELLIAAYCEISGRKLRFFLNSELHRELMCPVGWRWKSHDGGSISLVRRDNSDCDYHLTRADFAAPMRDLVAKAEDNLRIREAQAAKLAENEKLERDIQALAKGCVVTMHDSKVAGNCVQGTLQFARQNGIDEPSMYDTLPAEALLRMGGRAALAAKVAIMRQTEWSI